MTAVTRTRLLLRTAGTCECWAGAPRSSCGSWSSPAARTPTSPRAPCPPATYTSSRTTAWSPSAPTRSSCGRSLPAHEGLGECPRLERRQVVGPLPQADQLHRDAELALDRDDDAALGRAVELGQDDAGDVDGLGEDPRLDDAVLAGRGVEDEQHLGDGRLLLGHPLDLAQLVHQPRLRVQPPGRVDDDGVGLALHARAHGLEGDRGGVAALASAHGEHTDPLAPCLELIGGRGAE